MAINAGTVFFTFKADVAHVHGQVSKLQQSFNNIKRVLAGVEVAAAAAFLAISYAIKKTFTDVAEFDSAMRRLQVVMGANADTMKVMAANALKFAIASGRAPKEITDTFLRIAQAGYESAEAITETTKAAVKLSIAGPVAADKAADLLTAVMQGYGALPKELDKVANTLAVAAKDSKATIEDLIEGFKFVGPVARQMGMSFEQTAAALAVLSDENTRAGLGGRQFRTTLISTFAPTLQATKLLAQYDIHLRDSSNQMRNFFEVAEEMKKKLDPADFAKVFTRLAMSASIIFGTRGIRIQELLAGIHSDTKALADLTAAELGSIKGKWDQLGASIEAARIEIGKSNSEGLIKFLDTAKELVLTIKNLILDHSELIVSFAVTAVKAYAVAKGLMLIIGLGRLFQPMVGLVVTALGALATGLIKVFANPALLLSAGKFAAAIGGVGLAIYGVVKANEWLNKKMEAAFADETSWVSKLGAAYDKFEKMQFSMRGGSEADKALGAAAVESAEMVANAWDKTKNAVAATAEIIGGVKFEKALPMPSLAFPAAANRITAADKATVIAAAAPEALPDSFWGSIKGDFLNVLKWAGQGAIDILREFAPGLVEEGEKDIAQFMEAWRNARAKARAEAQADLDKIKAPPAPPGPPVPFDVVAFGPERKALLGAPSPKDIAAAKELAIQTAAVENAFEGLVSGIRQAGVPLTISDVVQGIIASSEVIQELGQAAQNAIAGLGAFVDALFGVLQGADPRVTSPIMGGAAFGGIAFAAGLGPVGIGVAAGVGIVGGIIGGILKKNKQDAAEAKKEAAKAAAELKKQQEELHKLVEKAEQLSTRASTDIINQFLDQFNPLIFWHPLVADAEAAKFFGEWRADADRATKRFLQAADPETIKTFIDGLTARAADLQFALALGGTPLGLSTEEMEAELAAITYALDQAKLAVREFSISLKGTSELLSDAVSKALAQVVAPKPNLIGGIRLGKVTAPGQSADPVERLTDLIRILPLAGLETVQSELQRQYDEATIILGLVQAGFTEITNLSIPELEAIIAFAGGAVKDFGKAVEKAAEFIWTTGGEEIDRIITESLQALGQSLREGSFGFNLVPEGADLVKIMSTGSQKVREELANRLREELISIGDKKRLLEAGLTLSTGESLSALQHQFDVISAILTDAGFSLTEALSTVAGEILNVPSGYKIDLARYRAIMAEMGLRGTGPLPPPPPPAEPAPVMPLTEPVTAASNPELTATVSQLTTLLGSLTGGFASVSMASNGTATSLNSLSNWSSATTHSLGDLRREVIKTSTAFGALNTWVPTP